MKYTNNAIFTRVYTELKDIDETINVTQTYSPIPSKFPTVYIREIGRLTPADTATLSNAQDISERTWEAQVFSNLGPGAKEQAYQLLDAVKSVLRTLYFVETFESPMEQTDKTIYCLVARFRRVIGSGEDMPEGSIPSI